MFLAIVVTNPNYQLFLQVHVQSNLFETINLFILSMIIENMLKLNVVDQKESSINNNPTTRSVGDDRSELEEDIV